MRNEQSLEALSGPKMLLSKGCIMFRSTESVPLPGNGMTKVFDYRHLF